MQKIKPGYGQYQIRNVDEPVLTVVILWTEAFKFN